MTGVSQSFGPSLTPVVVVQKCIIVWSLKYVYVACNSSIIAMNFDVTIFCLKRPTFFVFGSKGRNKEITLYCIQNKNTNQFPPRLS